MNILILNSWYYPNLKGGAEHSVKLLAENLAKKDHNVAVFSIDSISAHSINKDVINNVVIYRGTGNKYNIRKAYDKSQNNFFTKIKNKILEIYNPSIKKELDFVYKDFNPDIIHCNCIAGISLYALDFFKNKNIPIVYTVRDYFLDSPKNIIENIYSINILYRFILKCYRFFSKKKTKKVNAFTAPSDFVLKYMLNHNYFSKANITQTIVNCIDFNIEDIKEQITKKNNHLPQTLMYAGSIVNVKGIIPMVNAFMNTNIKSTFYICGDGPLSNWIKECAQKDNRIQFLGKLKPEEIENIYKQSDIIIVPSLWDEPFGRVVIEGAKYGLVVLGSNNGGIPEIISKLHCGIICKDINNEKLLQENIEYLFNTDLSYYRSLTINRIAYYSIENQIHQFEQIYNQLVNLVSIQF